MELMKATIEDKALLKTLYSFYLHDLSAYNPTLTTNEEGAFEFDSFHLFWEKEGISPYLIKDGAELIGFFLLLEKPLMKQVDYCINDFFIYSRYRGKGYGEKVLEQLFEEKQGVYFIEQMVNNKKAVFFWKKIYKQFNIEFEEELHMEDDIEVISQTFEMKKTQASV
ncbi:GNAT family N-acetyltransferase [Neobacillus sp. D3-1R]|uniref:GNAT family N-acetyltransferase n=1 Tax=Neobacillus sp. D3-1R TaxID=3445778 RepID=UPI003FA09006